MSFLICLVPVCPLRAAASHRSEQVSQLLFGEMCELLESSNDFARIRVLYDNYEGWCQVNQLQEVSYSLSSDEMLAGDWVSKITISEQTMHVPFGSSLSFLKQETAIVKKYLISHAGSAIYPGTYPVTINAIKKLACIFVNTPYLWGGRSVFGVDCSGFTQVVFKCMTVPLLRDAHQQATQGETVQELEEVRCGDLAFFDNEAGRITHVGILFDSNTIIHASGKVRIDTIDKSGILNSETGQRTHKLRIIKRVINQVVDD